MQGDVRVAPLEADRQAKIRAARLRGVLFIAASVATILTSYLASHRPADEPIVIEGVIDSPGQPVHLALADVSPDGTSLVSTSLVPTSDSYLFHVNGKPKGNLVVTARSAGFQPTVVGTSSKGAVKFSAPRLKPVPQPPRAQVAPERKAVTVTTGMVSSGAGADFSAPYEICSDSQPDVVPAGFEVEASEFRLEGDRACGSWSTCEQTVNKPSRACWSFRLQGHSECLGFKLGPFGAGTCNPRGQSAGVLTLHLIRTASDQSAESTKDALTLYVQTDGDPNKVDAICAGLGAEGVKCPGAVFGSFEGGSRVTYFNPDDLQVANALAARLRAVYGDIAVTQFHESGPVVRSTSSPRGQLELWLHSRSAP